jgi:O-antigen/teichoic acid export membrane protein
MSRYADSARDSLNRAYVLSLRLLLLLSVPIAAGTPFIAEELIRLLGGDQFLPHSVIALQIVIFFFPVSCINQVSQYVLIALDEQRFLTRAFAIGVSFNLIGNLIMIPLASYQGAAVITVLSEVALLIPFYYCLRKHLPPLPWVSLLWRPAVASLCMAATLWLTSAFSPLVQVPLAAAVYALLLVATGAFKDQDMAALRELMPASWRPMLSRLLPGDSSD